MTTPYRDPAEIIKETRAQVESKKFKYKFREWHLTAGFIFVIIVIIGSIGSCVYYQNTSPNSALHKNRREKEEIQARENQTKQDRLTGPCSLFGQEKITGVPARCISYFNNQNAILK